MNSTNIKLIDDLAQRHNYLSEEIKFLFGRNIWEYDIRQANINALRALNRIDDNEYNLLSSIPKQLREVYIGKKILEDHSIQDSIYQGIYEAKFKFLKHNNIKLTEVLRIANDAIYVISPIPKNKLVMYVNDFPITFVLKNQFTSYMSLYNNILFFFKNNIVDYNIDIKGIKDEKLYLHETFISFICKILEIYENAGKETALQIFNQFYESYIKGELPVEYYREFNNDSGFRVKMNNLLEETYIFNSPEGIPFSSIDTNYNLSILRLIYSYLLNAY